MWGKSSTYHRNEKKKKNFLLNWDLLRKQLQCNTKGWVVIPVTSLLSQSSRWKWHLTKQTSSQGTGNGGSPTASPSSRHISSPKCKFTLPMLTWTYWQMRKRSTVNNMKDRVDFSSLLMTFYKTVATQTKTNGLSTYAFSRRPHIKDVCQPHVYKQNA